MPEMRTFHDATELQDAVGEELGASDWVTIDQDRINTFADATGDHQWIHVDPERAKAGPFGVTIAHGYLTLALVPMLTSQIWTVEGVAAGINYGLNRVRFIQPVKVDSRIRSRAKLDSVAEVAGGLQLVVSHTIVVEVDGQEKTACVAETISRVLF
jgi:acyl dehydratase